MTPTETAGQATLTGISALVMSALGLEPQAIVWALVGSVLGVTLAKPSSRAYAALLFLAATLTCALMGSVVAEQYWPGRAGPRNFIIVAMGAGFHPLLQAFLARIPEFVSWAFDAIKRRLGGAR